MSKQESGIDQLIQRVRSEGVEKAQNQSEEIIDEAERRARAIIEDAHRNAQKIISDAMVSKSDDKRLLGRELEFAARDFSLKIGERLKEQFYFPNIRESVRATLKEPDFLKQVLSRLIVEYVRDNPCNLDVLVPKELKTTLAAFFASGVFDRLDNDCDIRLLDEEGLEGFVLIRRGEHYVWDFRVDTIAEELTRLVEPSLRKYFTAPNKTLAHEPKIAEAQV